MELSTDYIEKLNSIDFEWDFEYYEHLDGEDEPGLYSIRGEVAREWKKVKGWSQEKIEENSSIEFNQSEIAKIQSNAINTKSCSAYDKILLDHLFDMMDM